MGRLEFDLSGTPCMLAFSGFHQPLGIVAGSLTLTLPPWTYRRHLNTLRACTTASGANDLQLDSRQLCDAVLDAPGLADDARRLLAPLALWWAAGGDDPLPPAPAEGEWLTLGPSDDSGGEARARLRPWSERQRLSALNASLAADGDASWFDPVTYLDGMVRASLQALDAATGLDDLDARATAVLLHATVALNLCDDEDEALLQGGPAARECAARTLRLCQALGWTPARVWATPAIEVDRLLRMLDLVQPSAAAPRPAGRRSLADHPDATLIRIDDDPQERA